MSDKILSVFIDESGDFGAYDVHAPYYIIAMVLHAQSDDISNDIRKMEDYMKLHGYPLHAIHTGPLIRRESVYSYDMVENRKHLFNVLYNFTRRMPIKYLVTKIKKSECNDMIDMTAKISKSIAGDLKKHEAFFGSFSDIIVYYDNGQAELTKIITTVFNTLYSNVDIRKVSPVDYKLFQVADMICTLELLAEKAETKNFTNSEKEFFGNVRDFKKNYLKNIRKKQLDESKHKI